MAGKAARKKRGHLVCLFQGKLTWNQLRPIAAPVHTLHTAIHFEYIESFLIIIHSNNRKKFYEYRNNNNDDNDDVRSRLKKHYQQ